MSDVTKHYKVYPDKSQPNRFIVDIYEEAEGIHSFKRIISDLAGLSAIIRKFEHAGYIADSVQFDLY